MAEFLAGGAGIWCILGLMALEWLALWLWHARTGRGPGPRAIGVNLLAGAGLMLATRSAFIDAPPPEILAWLVLAGLGHGADLVGRLKPGQA